MKDFMGYLLMVACFAGFVVFMVRSSGGNAAARRHDRYQRKFTQANTHHDRLRHATAYLHEVAGGANDAKVGAIAKELFALAAKHNSAPATPTVVAKQAV